MSDIERELRRLDQEEVSWQERSALEASQRDYRMRRRFDEYVEVLERQGVTPEHIFGLQSRSGETKRFFNPANPRRLREDVYTHLGLGWPVDVETYDPEFVSASSAATYYYIPSVGVFAAKARECPERLGRFKVPDPVGGRPFSTVHIVDAPKEILQMSRSDRTILVAEGVRDDPAESVGFSPWQHMSDGELVEHLASRVRHYIGPRS